MFWLSCRWCTRQARIISNPLVTSTLPGLRHGYAVQLKSPRDRAISAPIIKFIDVNGDFQGFKRLSEVFRSYDPSIYTLINLTPTQDEPTCRLYTKEALKEMESKAYTKKREKSKLGSDQSKVLKECILNWNVTEHDLQHKLDSGLNALKKGNRLDLLIGTKTRRGAKATSRTVREQLLEKVVAICDGVGKECKKREGTLETGIILHYLGTATSTREDDSTPE